MANNPFFIGGAPDLRGGLMGGLLGGLKSAQGQEVNQLKLQQQQLMNEQLQELAARNREISGLQTSIADASQRGGFDPASNLDVQRLGVLNPEMAKDITSTARGLSDVRKKDFFKSAQTAQGIMNNENIPMPQRMGLVHELATKRRKKIAALGGDTTDTDLILNAIESGNLAEAQQALNFAVAQGKQAGFLGLSEEEKLQQRLNLERQKNIAAREEDARKRELDRQKEFRKEERATAKQSVTNFNKRASTVRDSFNKIERVLSPKKLNRRDIASAITALARLVSPGIVTEQDFQALTGIGNPLSELFGRIRGKGTQESQEFLETVQQFYDPTNPLQFDKVGFMRTVRNVAGGEIPSLVDQFNMARTRAETAGLDDKVLETNFGQNANMEALKKILSGSVMQGQTVEEKQAELAALRAKAAGG